MAPRTAIIGGGITGCFSAYFLTQMGAEATIVERGEIGGQASSRNAGGLNPVQGAGIPGPLGELALASLRLHLEHWGELRRLSAMDFGGRSASGLQLALVEAEVPQLLERGEPYDATPGFSAEWLSPHELAGFEPRLRDGLAGALHTEGNFRVDCAAYTQAVATAAAARGADVVRADAVGLSGRDGRVDRVVIDGGRIECDAVVIATGPWCEAPAEWLGVELPVDPVKGELLLAEPADGPPRVSVSRDGLSVYVADAGRVLIGATEERAGFDDRPNPGVRERLLAEARELLPGLGALKVLRHTAGLRPVSRDLLPIIGLAPGWENVFLAVGSGRKGMLLSAALGKTAADVLMRDTTQLPIEGCAPGRASLSAAVGAPDRSSEKPIRSR